MHPTADPFAGLYDEGNGVPALRLAAAELRAGSAARAREHVRNARMAGVPADAAPHAAVLEGLALVAADEAALAVDVLEAAWAEHPDVAALPAALGAARRALGEHETASRVLLAAVATDDPDGTLAAWRPLLARLVS